MSLFKRFLALNTYLSYAFIAFCFASALGCAVYFIFVRTPQFLFTIKKDLSKNARLMALIGEETGYTVYYSGEEAPQRIFRVKITGGCTNASLTVSGTYNNETYVVTDTVIIKCLRTNKL
jgi:hypothetical protein